MLERMRKDFTDLKFKTGKTYSGQVLNGNLHGIGEVKWDAGVVF